ncbi:MAG: diacylglycerol kinase family protein [Vicinamibacterales bacterium]|jgi:diacylglycerol kinase family enzyme
MRTVSVILNRSSGSAAAKIEALQSLVANAGLKADVLQVSGAEITTAALRAARAGHVLVAAGGDGTASTVAGVAVRNGATFGVIPLGTLNHFARDAGIPLELDKAVATIAAGGTRALDVGLMNDATFLNNVSLGLYPQLVWERQREQSRGRRKSVAFLIALVRTWRHYPTVGVHMTVDNVELLRRTPFVFIGNGEYHAEGMDLGTRASLNSGTLSVYLAPGVGRLEFLQLPIRALRGRLRDAVKFESFPACDVRIETRGRLIDVALDGELRSEKTPLRCTIRRGALTTLVPQGT